MEVKPGDILAGKYQIERVLGRGGMGVVVAALHLQLGERIALKFLLPEALQNAEAVARFAREARAAVRIKSEHVARVADVGTLDNGSPYMVMEYLEGLDLSAWLQQRGALPAEQAIEFVLQACEAIAEAHVLGIVHRDLKPANLFVVERADGSLALKVLDFGISKAEGASAGLTKTSATMGSPLYMSPEQVRSPRDVDQRSDIWALGVVLYELVAARAPFDGETFAELVYKIVTAPPAPLACPSAPPALEAVILKCLEKEAAQRYRSVGELAIALSPIAPRGARPSVKRIASIIQRGGMSATALELAPSSDTPAISDEHAEPGKGTLASWGQTTPPKPGRGRLIVTATALLALTSVAGVILVGRAASTTARALAEGSSGSSTHAATNDAATATPVTVTSGVSLSSAIAAEPAESAMASPPNPSAQPDSVGANAAPKVEAAPHPKHAVVGATSSAGASNHGRPALAVVNAPPTVAPTPAAPPVREKNPLKMNMIQ